MYKGRLSVGKFPHLNHRQPISLKNDEKRLSGRRFVGKRDLRREKTFPTKNGARGEARSPVVDRAEETRPGKTWSLYEREVYSRRNAELKYGLTNAASV